MNMVKWLMALSLVIRLQGAAAAEEPKKAAEAAEPAPQNLEIIIQKNSGGDMAAWTGQLFSLPTGKPAQRVSPEHSASFERLEAQRTSAEDVRGLTFSDLGLDQSTLLPSQLTEPPTGQRGTPPLPVPYPRTGQGGEPRQTVPDAITGNQDPNLPTQFPGRYPYRPEPAAPPPGGPPPGPPAPAPPGLGSVPEPTPSPVSVPAPDEVPAQPNGGQR